MLGKTAPINHQRKILFSPSITPQPESTTSALASRSIRPRRDVPQLKSSECTLMR